ncbi:MAG TPA: hypothetical protein VI756_08020 [Blastocatellia bacterium]
MVDKNMTSQHKSTKRGKDGPVSSGLSNVLVFEGWKDHGGGVAPRPAIRARRTTGRLTRREKQAVLLAFILSDDTEESRLDAVLRAAFPPGLRSDKMSSDKGPGG